MRDFEKLKYFTDKQCPYTNHWCNGKHIPCFKKENRANPNYSQYDNFTDIDLSKVKDRREVCEYLQNGRCMHKDNPNKIYRGTLKWTFVEK